MDFLDLKIFAAVAEEGGIGKAARRLNTVQSNVTTRMRLLEEQVGMPLLLRHSRGISLTRAGQRLLPYAQQAVNLVKQARIAVKDDGEPVGSLRLGAVETSAAFRIPPLMSKFVVKNPAVQVDFETGPTAALIEAVLDQKLDGAFVVGPTKRPELVEVSAFREELWLWTSSQWPSIDAYLDAAVTPTIIAMRAGCSYRAMAEDHLRRGGERTFKLMELATLEGVIGLVAAGLGVALLPRAMIEASAMAGHLRRHDFHPDKRHVETVFIRRRDVYQPTAMRRFVDCIESQSENEPRQVLSLRHLVS